MKFSIYKAGIATVTGIATALSISLVAQAGWNVPGTDYCVGFGCEEDYIIPPPNIPGSEPEVVNQRTAQTIPTGYRSLRLQRDGRHLQRHEVNGAMTDSILLYNHGSNPPSHAIWKIEPVGNGYYTLRLQRDGRHLQGHEVNGAMTDNILLYNHGSNPPSHAIWEIE